MSPASDVRVLGEGRWLRLVDDGGWEYAERSGSNGVVVIVAVTDDDRLVLVEQYRPAVKARVIEAPAGLVGDLAGYEDEDRLAAASRVDTKLLAALYLAGAPGSE